MEKMQLQPKKSKKPSSLTNKERQAAARLDWEQNYAKGAEKQDKIAAAMAAVFSSSESDFDITTSRNEDEADFIPKHFNASNLFKNNKQQTSNDDAEYDSNTCTRCGKCSKGAAEIRSI